MSDVIKVSLLEMVLWAEGEAERIETWRRVLQSERTAIDPGVMRRGLIARKAAETLDLVREHQQEFVALVQAARKERAKRAGAAATSASTEPSSDQSTSGTPPSAKEAR